VPKQSLCNYWRYGNSFVVGKANRRGWCRATVNAEPPCTLRFSDLYPRDETLKPELLFLIVAFCGGILGFGKAGGFKNRGVMIGLSISAIAMLVVLFIEWEKLC
jgi:hypothetical protein